MGVLVLWVACLAILALSVVSLMRLQAATSVSGKVVTGSAAMMSGVIGLMLLAFLLLT